MIVPPDQKLEKLTYTRYLHVDDLLTLQRRRTQAHDELQFIIVHQVFELWFKLLLFEVESIRSAMDDGDPGRAIHLLRRAHEIVRNLTAAFPILETMPPYSFLEFRSELKPASGFQSRQFREIEFLSGLKDDRYVRALEADPKDREALQARLGEPTVWDSFLGLLRREGLAVATDQDIVQSLIAVHKDPARGRLNDVVEALLEYDLLFALWRGRHVLMVERMIGARAGTGQKTVEEVVGEGYSSMGSGGVEYLKSTLAKRFFPLIWESRTFIER